MKKNNPIQSDVQSQKSLSYQALNWVGMTRIQASVLLKSSLAEAVSTQQSLVFVPATLDLGVNLFENHRGIHMSRLYRLFQESILNQELHWANFCHFADEGVRSQQRASDFCSWKLSLQWPIVTDSLKSGLSGYRQYPVDLVFESDLNEHNLWVSYEILYSSTCPQSASLSLEVQQQQSQELANQDQLSARWWATPHAQRSRALVQLQLSDFNQDILESLIAQTEQALGTPVQTVVKKADEMEFARLNAENLMFCEDAARKIKNSFEKNTLVRGGSVFCEHQESLHPHNASSLMQWNYLSPRVRHSLFDK